MSLALDALAAFRLWRLAARDELTADLRERWEAFAYAHLSPPAEPGHGQPVPKAIVLVGCPWCLGFWLTIAVVALRNQPWWRPARDALAVSALVGLIAERLDHE
jgi:Protein of unknown function (DUF1360)